MMVMMTTTTVCLPLAGTMRDMLHIAPVQVVDLPFVTFIEQYPTSDTNNIYLTAIGL
jgi:hypothetical protein